METPQERFDETLMDFVDRIAKLDLSDEDATTAVRNLKTFSECRPPKPEPEPEPITVPTTRMEKAMATAARVLDNETARTTIKAVGAFAGIALVAYATIHKDHVLERQALAQTTQRMI